MSAASQIFTLVFCGLVVCIEAALSMVRHTKGMESSDAPPERMPPMF